MGTFKWTDENVKFIQSNYPKEGASFCAQYLNTSKNTVIYKTRKMKIFFDNANRYKFFIKDNNKFKVNLDKFTCMINKNSAYILGILWADGTVQSWEEKNKKRNYVSIMNEKNDMLELQNIFDDTGIWNTCEPKTHKINEKPTLRLYTHNRPLVHFLIQNDYHKKSGASAKKIINHIPDHLRHYFFLGLIDGDGCWYHSSNPSNRNRQFSIVSTYDQNWDFMEELCNDLDIRCFIHRVIGKKGKYSKIEIFRKKHLMILKNYLYPKEYEIGLFRKYIKAIECTK